MNTTRIDQQLGFLQEIDKVKEVERRNLLLSGLRRENDAEHSWHLAVMALLLAEHAESSSLRLHRVLLMVLIHDLVEIDAGDTYCYDTEAKTTQRSREIAAADRIFGLLPTDQARQFREAWDEFEARESPEARFAHALDRFQPLVHNYLTEGHSWREHDVAAHQVRERCQAIAVGSPRLGEIASQMIDDAVNQGWLRAE